MRYQPFLAFEQLDARYDELTGLVLKQQIQQLRTVFFGFTQGAPGPKATMTSRCKSCICLHLGIVDKRPVWQGSWQGCVQSLARSTLAGVGSRSTDRPALTQVHPPFCFDKEI